MTAASSIPGMPSVAVRWNPRTPRTSADRPGNLPQKHLEPLLRRKAEALNESGVLFQHEATSLTQFEGGVEAQIAGASGLQRVTARFAIAADGGNMVGPALAIPMTGLPPFVKMVGLHFRADLSAYLQDDTSLIRMVVHPNDDGVLVTTGIVGMGPTRWDRHSEEWHLNIVVPIGVEMPTVEWTDELAIAHIRDILKIVDLQPEILRISEWDVEGVLADQYRLGNVFLVGDAAHRHPPTTGLGLNTAVADVHNLVWKLAAVLHGQAQPALLDSYEAERRPVGARNVDWAMFTFFNHLACQSGWGVLPGVPPEANVQAFHAALENSPAGRARFARLAEFLYTQRTEYQAHDIEMGYGYEDSSAIVADGTDLPDHDPMGTEYRPTTRPGGRLPHAWLERKGARVATHELLRPGAFLLLAGPEGHRWCDAAAEVATNLGIQLDAIRVGMTDVDLIDADGAWRAVRGYGDDGAVLVRPDGHVLHRAHSSHTDPGPILDSALRRSLGLALPAQISRNTVSS